MKLNPKYNGRYIEGAGGTRLFVEENGDLTRPTILWIHGYCQCRLSWDRVRFIFLHMPFLEPQGWTEGV